MDVNISVNLSHYLKNPKSREARAFFDGARSMMTALQLAPASEYPSMLSTSNQQHIISILVQSSEQQCARRRKDAQQLLKLYSVDKMSFLAFVFDLPRINMQGQAVDENGIPLEDTMFRLLPGKSHDGWPDRAIEHLQTDQKITRAEFLALSDLDQIDYSYRRFFYLNLDGSPSLRICSSDRYLMEELIRQSILIGDPDINRRYLMEIGLSAEDGTVGKLYDYRNAIVSAINELRETNQGCTFGAAMTTQASFGYIKTAGQFLIAQLQSFTVSAKPDILLMVTPMDVSTWIEIIQACRTNDDAALAKFITDDDIAGYQDVNGCLLPGAVCTEDKCWVTYRGDTTIDMQKNFFKHILVEARFCRRLAAMLSGDWLKTADANPCTVMALHKLMDALSADGSLFLDQLAEDFYKP